VAAGPGSKAPLDWLRKQFASLGIQLQIRSTDFNRFQAKVRTGNFQIIRWGWGADYPDPENFFFLLYGPNGRAHHGGENHVNYTNPRFDALFREMENMSNSPQRLALIERMTAIIQHDAPWVWGMHPVVYGLYPAWYHNAKPMLFGRNSLKYKRVDAALRHASRQDWNRPVTLPVWILAGLFVLTMIPATLTIYRRGWPARIRADAP
jgi:ABC-type oligopeptide transport system substrate-binding subunit